ncbi:hypothetical protein Tco_1365142, partial [Tanacetum coccineum]
ANTPLNENCLTVLLRKLPEKLGDPGKFLIPCDVSELGGCKALADLGASINLMPLSFSFLADFVVIDYDIDPRVPLILGRPFLRTARALVDVHGEELILRVGDEKIILNTDSTSKSSHRHKSVNMINFIDITCEDHCQEVLNIQNSSTNPSSGSPSPSSDSIVLSPFRSL